MKTIWLDLLCFRSVLKIYFLSRKFSIEKIYYINRTKRFSKFFINLLIKLVKKPIEQIDWISESDEKIEDISLYELIQTRLKDILETWSSEKDISKESERYCKKYDYDLIKFKEYLKDGAYRHIFRFVEISVLAEKISGQNNSLYVFHTSPFNKLVKILLQKKQVFFYNSWFLSNGGVEKRKDYFYDNFLNKHYFSNKFEAVRSTLMLFLSSFISSIFYKILGRDICSESAKSVNIGVDLIYSRVRINEINDLYWLKDSDINPETVWGIEHENYDQESKENLAKLGIRRCKLLENPLHLVSRAKNNPDNVCRYVTIGVEDCIKAMGHILRLFSTFLSWNENGWLQYKKTTYAWGTSYWKSVYRQLGIRMLWSMYDINPDKPIKAQALEKLDGLYMGSHWSNHPMYRADLQRCQDVLFTWGPYFKHHFFNNYPAIETFQTGYPLDFYFESKKKSALKLSNKYPKKFILSYHDNIMAQDLMYSKEMQLKLHKMLMSLIKNNPNLIVFLKPKRKFVLDFLIKELPILQQYINENRIEVFLGETPRSKAVPATIGMASDLVVGLGISTAATECFFAGSIGFHADLTGFARNEFANKGLGSIVFRDIESLKKAIQDRINGKDTRSHKEFNKYYKMLDPFQDGKAYKRTGFLIRELQKSLESSKSRKESVQKTRQEYNKLLKKKTF